MDATRMLTGRTSPARSRSLSAAPSKRRNARKRKGVSASMVALLQDAWLLEADSAVLAVVDFFYYRDPRFTGGDRRHLIIPDEDVESFVAALRDALVEVTVKP
jgi:hypothetical protein